LGLGLGMVSGGAGKRAGGWKSGFASCFASIMGHLLKSSWLWFRSSSVSSAL
jgi:hypothetical protein